MGNMEYAGQMPCYMVNTDSSEFMCLNGNWYVFCDDGWYQIFEETEELDDFLENYIKDQTNEQKKS